MSQLEYAMTTLFKGRNINNFGKSKEKINLDNQLTLNGEECISMWDHNHQIKRVAIVNASNNYEMTYLKNKIEK